ncbi:hypothetical protein D4764_05G0005400, partial [Takifugu flavidus]
LDGTVDLDERRLIRSAIRELRRREIEDMEAALATKRFRPTRLKLQEDKENQHRSESAEKLDVLSKKLQSVQDIDELTKMLRAASEYEERKMIRAAIRKIRDEQQQGECSCLTAPRESVPLSDAPSHPFDQHVAAVCVSDPSLLLLLGNAEKSKATVRCLDPENVEPQSSLGTVVSSAESDRCGFSEVILMDSKCHITTDLSASGGEGGETQRSQQGGIRQTDRRTGRQACGPPAVSEEFSLCWNGDAAKNNIKRQQQQGSFLSHQSSGSL